MYVSVINLVKETDRQTPGPCRCPHAHIQTHADMLHYTQHMYSVTLRIICKILASILLSVHYTFLLHKPRSL